MNPIHRLPFSARPAACARWRRTRSNPTTWIVARLRLVTNEFNGIFRLDTTDGQKFILRVTLPEGGHDLDHGAAETEAFDTAIEFHLNDMKAIFDQPGLTADEKLMEVTHYGMRRLRERAKGSGYSWPLTFTAVLVKVGADWRFHALHWAMPVD